MAEILGGIGVTHSPSVAVAFDRGHTEQPEWKPFFENTAPVKQWLKALAPDTLVVFYNDHLNRFQLSTYPTFAIGCDDVLRVADEGHGRRSLPDVPGDSELAWHLCRHLVANEFDITMCQEMLIDHAVTIPMTLMWPGQRWPVKIVPVSINTVQHPLPSLSRCLKLGRSIGRALESYQQDLRVMIIGTGGLSHQLDGERAGFINKEFDELCLDKIVNDPEALTRYSIHDWVELAGAQGVEFLNWMAMRGALTGEVTQVHRNYHIPISNTAAATIVLENGSRAQRSAA